MMHAQHTIFALATAPGRAGVAVIRISGYNTAEILRNIGAESVKPRTATLRHLKTPNGKVFDHALVLWFPGPNSFTGEDVGELHLHGGPAVIQAAIHALTHWGARQAEPGEFSRRAFANGKLDLTQAEAIADLVDAETTAQLSQALRQMDGELSKLYETWREHLIAAMAQIEGEIDFPDEGDVPGGLAARAAPQLDNLATAIADHLNDNARGERIRDGFHIAIIGPPNAGKSTLLNALLGRDAAIVTDIPGTTRDVVEGRIVLGGYAVILADTAGLRDTDDVVEQHGVARAKDRAEKADLRLLVLDGSDAAAAKAALNEFQELLRPGDIIVRNKADLAAPPADATSTSTGRGPANTGTDSVTLSIAAQAGQNLDALEDAITDRVVARLSASEAPALTRARHRAALEAAHQALARALARLTGDDALLAELAGEDVRIAARALGEITGHVDVDHILDRIFSEFCIGK